MPGLGVIVNPQSKRHTAGRSAEVFARIVGEQGLVREAGSHEELARIADELARARVDLVVIGGGDGTNSVTLTALRAAYGDAPLPRVALLRGGTMNTVANALALSRGDPATLLVRLVARYATREPLDEVRVATMDVGGMLGFLCGVGAVHGFLDQYYARSATPTFWTAVRTLARGAASAAIGGETVRAMAGAIEADVTVDGERWPTRRYLSVAAGTIDQIGLGFRPFWRAREDTTRFQILGIHCSAARFVASGLPRMRVGKPLAPGDVHDALAREAVITPARGPTRYMIDGDLYEREGPLTVRAGPVVRIVI